MSDEPKLIELNCETVRQSIIKDGITCLMMLAMAGIGQLLGNDAIMWLGAIFFLAMVVAWGMQNEEKNRKSPQQAADWLLKEYGVIGKTEE